jgi:CubicO group peptidase (beta-lactamase class C family)
MTPDTICRAESISKSVTARGVMKLVEQGLISLDTPVEQYLTDWNLSTSDQTVTVEQLLSNTAGLPLGLIGPPTEYAPGQPKPSARAFLADQVELVREPGAGFLYSDVGFNLLELLIEEVTGDDFAAYMKTEVLAPLDMHDASFMWREAYGPAMATGYEMDGTPVAPYVYPASASGGLLTDVNDLARFVAGGMNGSEAVLSPQSLQAIYEPRVEIPGLFGFVADAYGFGHFIETLPDGRKAVWHGGQGHGWMTHFHAVPETGDGIVVLTNSQRSWPFLAALLSDWARWSGIGSVSFGIITAATRGLWVVIAVVAIASLVQLYRLLAGIRRGNRRFAGGSGAKVWPRLVQGIAGLGLLGLLAWRVTLPYVFERSIFPAAFPWAVGALALFGVVLIASALVPPVSHPS